ncbi:MAG TPA: hypothetical protein PK395_07210 [bacterium]|nr:hypothetical protein [bacterium]HQP96910.1 hypothetical protein [bacterium]
MRRNEIRLTEHFLLSEFEDKATGLVCIHPLLPLRLEQLRIRLGTPLQVTSSCRTWSEHRRIYRQQYGERWAEEICLMSRHLLCGPDEEDFQKYPVLLERLGDLMYLPVKSTLTCCAADIRQPANIPPGTFETIARSLFDFVKPYPWGLHVDLRHTSLDK